MTKWCTFANLESIVGMNAKNSPTYCSMGDFKAFLNFVEESALIPLWRVKELVLNGHEEVVSFSCSVNFIQVFVLFCSLHFDGLDLDSLPG